MNIDQILSPEKILFNQEATNREELIDVMLEKALPSLSKSLKKEFVASLLEREKLGTISLGNGVVVPHARSKKIESIQCVLAISRNGLLLNSIDYQRIHFVFLMLIPETHQHDHLRVLAQFSKILLNPILRKQLLQCEDAYAVVDIVKEQQQLM